VSNDSDLLNLRQKVSTWDHEIRSGHAGLVRKELYAYKNSAIPRSLVTELADLARRVQLPFLIIRWLKPFVRPDRELLESTADERALYASGLMRVGAHNEAQFILDSITDKQNSKALLFQSHLDVLQWNYGHSITILKKYLRTIESDTYTYAVGCLNLAAAHVAELDWLRAEPALKSLLKICLEKKYYLLLANGLELSAQMAIQRSDYQTAHDNLNEALTFLRTSGGKDDLYIKKWKAIAGLLQHQQSIQEFREFAIELKSWETVRELDFYHAKSEKNSQLYLQVHFGTRFSSYRQQMKRVFKPQFSIPDKWEWSFGYRIEEGTPWIDLQTGETSKAGVEFNKERLLLLALQTLAKDFYRPFRVGELMQEIYPEEYFDPISSPARVFQTLRRLRLWLSQNGFPLRISLIKGQFMLEATGPIILRVYRRRKIIKSVPGKLLNFLNLWSAKTFTSNDVQNIIGFSKRATQRLLQQAVTDGVLTKVQSGKKIVYRILVKHQAA
jgi:hypothetical protein